MNCRKCQHPIDAHGWPDICPKCEEPIRHKPPSFRERIGQSRTSKVAMDAWVAAYQAGANGLDMWRAYAEWSDSKE